MATILHLPDEILLSILKILYFVSGDSKVCGDKSDILPVRLVYTRLARVEATLAFRRITFVQDEEGMIRLLELSESPIRQCVRHLVCCFEDHNANLASSVNTFIESFKLGELASEVQKELFDQYRRNYMYQSFLEDRNLDVVWLAASLSRLPNLRAITIL